MPKTEHNSATGSYVDLIDFSSPEPPIAVIEPTEKLRTARIHQNGFDNQPGQWSTEPVKLVTPRFSTPSQVSRQLTTNSIYQHPQAYETPVNKEPSSRSSPPLVPPIKQDQWQEPLSQPPQPPPPPPPYRDPPPAPTLVRQTFTPAAAISKADLLAEIRLRGGFQGAGLQRVEETARCSALYTAICMTLLNKIVQVLVITDNH